MVNTSGGSWKCFQNEAYSPKIVEWIDNIANFLLYVGAVLAVIFIIWGGITYMFAGGNSEKAEKAKTRIWNGIIGALIVLGVGVIINTLTYLVGSGISF